MTSSEPGSAVASAAGWLRGYMQRHDGQAGAGAVLIAAVGAGHAPRTVRRAATAIGVSMARRGQGTVWTLTVKPEPTKRRSKRGQSAANVPDHSGHAVPDKPTPPAEAEPVTPPRTWRVPGRSDIYGHVTAFTQVSSPAAASHWDERQWHRVSELDR